MGIFNKVLHGDAPTPRAKPLLFYIPLLTKTEGSNTTSPVTELQSSDSQDDSEDGTQSDSLEMDGFVEHTIQAKSLGTLQQ